MLRCVRTTLNLDDDVAAQLAHLDRENATPRGPFTRAVSLGAPQLPDVDGVSKALPIIEGKRYR